MKFILQVSSWRIVQIFHQVTVTFFALLVEQFSWWVFQKRWQIFVQHLAGLAILRKSTVAFHNMFGQAMILLVVIDKLF